MSKAKPLDARTLWVVSRLHGRMATLARESGHRCNDTLHTWSARYWEARARAIERKAKASKKGKRDE